LRIGVTFVSGAMGGVPFLVGKHPAYLI
jgi:hypothetical protein